MLESITFAANRKVMSPTISPIVRVEEVSFTDNQRPILQQVSLVLMPGEIVSIIGPNGAGKTSLLKIIVGLISPSQGKVIRSPALRIGYMPQQLHIEPTFPLTVERFLRLGQPKADLAPVLQEVGIAHLLAHAMQTISGGELQRVLLARALLRKPELLVLDEPAQGVDLIGQGELYHLIARIRDRFQCAVLLVSHDLTVVMAQTDKVVCLNQHVCCSGHPEIVTQDPAFRELFGSIAQNLALYTHRHDHHHDIRGEVINDDDE